MSDGCKPLGQLGAPMGGATAGWPGAGNAAQNAGKHYGDILRGADLDPASVRYDAGSRTLSVRGLTDQEQRTAMRELMRHPDACHIARVDFGGATPVQMPQRRP